MALATIFYDDFTGSAGSLIGRAATGGVWAVDPTSPVRPPMVLDGAGRAQSSGANSEALVALPAFNFTKFAIEARYRGVLTNPFGLNVRLVNHAGGQTAADESADMAPTNGGSGYFFGYVNYTLSGGGTSLGPEIIAVAVGGETTFRAEYDTDALTFRMLKDGVELTSGALPGAMDFTNGAALFIGDLNASPRMSISHVLLEAEGAPPAPPSAFWTGFDNTREVV